MNEIKQGIFLDFNYNCDNAASLQNGLVILIVNSTGVAPVVNNR